MPLEAGGRLRLVTDVLRAFADATTDSARLLQTIVERIGGLVGHACSIRLLTEGGTKLATAALFDPIADPTFAKLASATIPVTAALRDALEHQRAYVDELTSQRGIAETHPDSSDMPKVARVLVAPLVARGSALGCLFVVQRATDATAFTNDDVDVVDALASHAALAIANSRLMTSLAEIEKARAHERSILDTVFAPLLLVDREARILDVNRAFSLKFGLADHDAVGKPILEVARSTFDVPPLRALFERLPPPDGAEDMEVELPTPAGARTFLVRTKKTFRPGNASETTLVTLVDVTDRIVAANIARRQRLLIASMNEAVVGLDRDFRVEQWNPAAERLFGWTADDVRGKPIADFFHSTDDRRRDENRRQLRAGKTVRSEVRIRSRAGEWVDLEFSTMPIVEKDEPTGYVCVMLDVTARKRLDHELRQRVDELTLSNAELESFSYSVSHDLRAPVRAIDGFSEILEEEHSASLDPEGRRMLGLVRKNAKRMGLLIDDLLALARYGRQPLVEEAVDMTQLARATLDEAVRAEPDRKIAATIGPLPGAFGDESLLSQVWLNLYANSVKYTRGRADAAIETTAAETEDEVVYTVKDNGAGFDMRYAAKLFGTFERLHTAKEFEGTGIGLALVARIVKRHGGRVWGEGEVGKGATFHFALPKQQKKGMT